jgi:hypothetical protein
MIINNFIKNRRLSSYNIQQKVDIIHSIRIETSCAKFAFSFRLRRTHFCNE